MLLALLAAGCGEKTTEPIIDDRPVDLLVRLQALPGCTAEEITPPGGAHYTRAFLLAVTQPVNHDNPEGPTFTQRVFLSHVDESAPTVLVTWGYDVGRNRSFELSEILQANQIYVAHRYHGDNRPVPFDWADLNVREAAGDHHRITQLLKTIYSGPWVNHGLSKGGTTAALHRWFYPDDVQATVVGVSGFFTSTHDPQVDDFLSNTVGTADCREKIKQLQCLALSRRDSLLPYYEAYADLYGLNYTRVGGIEAAFEYDVLEYSYIFWQYYAEGECELIPDETVSNQELFDYLQRISGVSFFCDAMCTLVEAPMYQFFTELGYYGFVTGHLDTLLQAVSVDPTYEFMAPQDVEMEFNPSIMHDIVSWLQTQGNNIIYFYGGVDPNTAAALTPSASTNSITIIQPGANHLMGISDLDDPSPVYDSLSVWLGLDLSQ